MAASSVSPTAARCAAHPARPAVDSCPTCRRPRCGADARGPRCTICSVQHGPVRGRPPTSLELVVRAALASHGAAFVAGLVNSEYIGSDYFAYVAPAVAGVATGAAATAAAPARRVLRVVRLLSVLYAVLAVAIGLAAEGTYHPLDAQAEVLLPYAIAGAAAWLWTAPPRRRRPKASPDA